MRRAKTVILEARLLRVFDLTQLRYEPALACEFLRARQFVMFVALTTPLTVVARSLIGV